MTLESISSSIIIYGKKFLEWIFNQKDKANKEQTNSADNSTKNYVTFNNCTFNGPTGKVLQSLSSSKK